MAGLARLEGGGLAVMLKLQFKAANSDGFPSMKHLLLNGSSVNIGMKARSAVFDDHCPVLLEKGEVMPSGS